MNIIYNPTYKDEKELQKFIAALPESFWQGGTMLWNARNKIKSFDINGNDIVVKSFRHLNIFRRLVYMIRKHKARKAFENGMEMVKRGVNTPEPVACVEIFKGKMLKESYYLYKGFTGMTEIVGKLEEEQWDKEFLKSLALFIADMHKKGVFHHDLNNTNILYCKEDGGYKFIVIDINRTSFYNSRSDAPYKPSILDLCRFTARYDLFEEFATEYAQACDIDNVPEWVESTMKLKIWNDVTANRRQKIRHGIRDFFKKIF